MYSMDSLGKDTIAMVLAGGKGERLSPLTLRRAKPSVAFGGKYKIIDFVLSNLFNSGIKKVYGFKILAGTGDQVPFQCNPSRAPAATGDEKF